MKNPKVGEIWALNGQPNDYYFLLVGTAKERSKIKGFLQRELNQRSSYKDSLGRFHKHNFDLIHEEGQIDYGSYGYEEYHILIQDSEYKQITKKLKNNSLTRKLYKGKIHSKNKENMFVYCTDITDIKHLISK